MPREPLDEKLQRMTRYETEYWQQGFAVAGIDEVGRGPLAGPVVTACVIVPPDRLILGVDDSKKLSEKKREALYEQIMQCADYVQLGYMDAQEIDRVNILNATKQAMEMAAAGAQDAYFLVDAMQGLILPSECLSIIHGDAESFMIAAASIIAKVTRDRMMVELDEKYPAYGFRRNKGYGTAEHIHALKEYGPCPEHRRSFIKNICSEVIE